MGDALIKAPLVPSRRTLHHVQMGKKTDAYDAELERLQLAVVKTQAWTIEHGLRVVIVLEGRDTAGKDGAIKRLTEHMSPRQTRVVALPKPSDRETTQWYFQRYVPHLPAAGETVIFNRSWYNRAGVEPVMGYCTPEQYAQFATFHPTFLYESLWNLLLAGALLLVERRGSLRRGTLFTLYVVPAMYLYIGRDYSAEAQPAAA